MDNIRDDALIRLGLSVGLRVSEIVSIRTSEVDFDRGVIKIWDEKRDKWRLGMPMMEAMSTIKKYLNSVLKQTHYRFQMSTKSVERIIQKHSKLSLGFVASWQSIRTTYEPVEKVTFRTILAHNWSIVNNISASS